MGRHTVTSLVSQLPGVFRAPYLYIYDTALEVDIKGKQTLLDQPHTTCKRVSQQGA